MRRALPVIAAFTIATVGGAQAPATPPTPAAQNPSPMVEHTRRHERLTRKEVGGVVRSIPGPSGKRIDVWIPERTMNRDEFDLVVHFFGEAWLPEQAVASLGNGTVAAVVNLGAGSGAYSRPFSDPAVFDSLIAGVAREVSPQRPGRVRRITLVGFSAGYGAVRSILADPRHFAAVNAALLLDGIHTSYIPDATPVAAGGTIDSTGLVVFAAFARAAMRGEKRFVISHSEIFPGTFASTTETTDWLIASLGLDRTPVLRWGPRGMQQLSEAGRGKLEILGFAGNSAPDHIDQLHAMPELLARVVR